MSDKSETFIACLRAHRKRERGYVSFSVTIPIEIVYVMGLKHGDYLRVKITKIELKKEER